LTFNGLHGLLSQKTLFFISEVLSNICMERLRKTTKNIRVVNIAIKFPKDVSGTQAEALPLGYSILIPSKRV
jgi:hypothetical protein